MINKVIVFASLWLCFGSLVSAQELESPNGKLEMKFSLEDDGTPTYYLEYQDKDAIKESKRFFHTIGSETMSSKNYLSKGLISEGLSVFCN